jgi:RTX calcium-binding nonapeptide repeat (4 copies)/FG-GAP-like repeat/Bacterial pre-peptidase C-terminal domain
MRNLWFSDLDNPGLVEPPTRANTNEELRQSLDVMLDVALTASVTSSNIAALSLIAQPAQPAQAAPVSQPLAFSTAITDGALAIDGGPGTEVVLFSAPLLSVNAPAFDIVINYTGNAAYQSYFTAAAQMWELIITGDVPDATLPVSPFTVDDLHIDASAIYIDGPGMILGQAGPHYYRPSYLPINGSMEFDSADLATLAANDQLQSVILHEMGHVLGIGTMWDLTGQVIEVADATKPTGIDYRYVGGGALIEYRLLSNNPAASYIQVESTLGGGGTIGGHWDEGSQVPGQPKGFDNELMTGFTDSDNELGFVETIMPISRMTIAALRDQGYQVDLGHADPYWIAATPAYLRDDHSGNYNAKTILAIGSSLTGNIELTEDNDWYQVNLTAGVTYTFQLRGAPGGGGSLSDAFLRLRAADGESLAFNNDSGTTDSRITVTSTSTGLFYLDASAAGAQIGTYTLSAAVGTSNSFTEGNDTVVLSDPGQTWHALGGNDNVTGTSGIDAIYGEAGSDTLYGAAGNDLLFGGADDDALYGGLGNDTLDGGAQSDTAAFTGARSQYTFSGGVKDFRITDTIASRDGVDTVKNVEFLRFSDGTFAAADVVPDKAPNDFNGDGKSDILWRHSDGTVREWQIDGTTIASQGHVGQPSNGFTAAGTGDFNGDGLDDVLWRHSGGTVSTWQLDGTNILGSSGYIGQPGNEFTIQGVGDFNGDGRDDVLWRAADGTVTTWLIGAGGNTIMPGSGFIGSMDNNWSIQGVGDFNGDDRDDILWRHTDGTVREWQLNGTTISGQGHVGQPSNGFSVAGIGDFNGDNRDDVLWRHSGGTVSTWQLDGLNVLGSSGYIGQPGNEFSIENIGDYNGDGRSDVLWRATDGTVTNWLLDGNTVLPASGFIGSMPTDWIIQ